MDYLEIIKQRIVAGTYRVDGKDLATKILRDEARAAIGAMARFKANPCPTPRERAEARQARAAAAFLKLLGE